LLHRTPLPSRPAATGPVDTGPLLSRPRPSLASRTSPCAPRASRVSSTLVQTLRRSQSRRRGLCVSAGAPHRLRLERGASTVDPAATGTVLQALKTICVHGSLGPFALEAGADVGAVDPAATGAALQAFFGARGGATPGMNDAVCRAGMVSRLPRLRPAFPSPGDVDQNSPASLTPPAMPSAASHLRMAGNADAHGGELGRDGTGCRARMVPISLPLRSFPDPLCPSFTSTALAPCQNFRLSW
jgi:hypothetical protein